jgi:hypothetical protein
MGRFSKTALMKLKSFLKEKKVLSEKCKSLENNLGSVRI